MTRLLSPAERARLVSGMEQLREDSAEGMISDNEFSRQYKALMDSLLADNAAREAADRP